MAIQAGRGGAAAVAMAKSAAKWALAGSAVAAAREGVRFIDDPNHKFEWGALVAGGWGGLVLRFLPEAGPVFGTLGLLGGATEVMRGEEATGTFDMGLSILGFVLPFVGDRGPGSSTGKTGKTSKSRSAISPSGQGEMPPNPPSRRLVPPPQSRFKGEVLDADHVQVTVDTPKGEVLVLIRGRLQDGRLIVEKIDIEGPGSGSLGVVEALGLMNQYAKDLGATELTILAGQNRTTGAAQALGGRSTGRDLTWRVR